MRALNISGRKFGRLTTIRRAETKDPYWECLCKCGKKKFVLKGNLLSGATRSCGCLLKEVSSRMGKATRRHSPESRRTILAWWAMKARCLNPKNRRYHSYGGRGIKVCERWLTYENFVADMGYAPAGMSIDRVNNDGDYEPSNCRWASRKEQMRNRRNTLYVMWQGRKAALSELCEKNQVNYQTAYWRLHNGQPIEKALSKEHREFFRQHNPRDKYITYAGQAKKMKEWAKEFGIDIGTLSQRLSKGMSVEKALTTPVGTFKKCSLIG